MSRKRGTFLLVQNISFLLFALMATQALASPWQATLREAQSKVVKIYGAGGLRQMEAYQTGVLISPQGHVLTAWSYVLDTDDLAVILGDGRKWQAQLVGSNPLLEIAVLKLSLEGEDVPYFDLDSADSQQVAAGDRVLALSNLYGIATGDEAVSVLQGVITAVAPLDARRGASRSHYRGQVYVLDASANNPGAAGGALVDWNGRLLGLLGKELRSRVTGTWLNYALPIESIARAVKDIQAGRVTAENSSQLLPEQSLTVNDLGLVLIPNVLARTPPYVDAVRRDSPAEQAGLRPNDLVVFVEEVPITSSHSFLEELRMRSRAESLTISVLRDSALLEFTLRAEEAASGDKKAARFTQPSAQPNVEEP